MLTRVLLLALLCGLVPAPGQAAPTLHSRATLDSPRPEPDGAELRWLWERRQLRLGVIERDNPPFDILGTGQVFEGLTADYAGLIADQLHLQVEVHAYASFAEAVAALRKGRSTCSARCRHNRRWKRVCTCREPTPKIVRC